MMVVAERKTEELPVAAARAGRPDAWEVLFKRYQLPLYAYVFDLARDEQASLDIVQETFVAAVHHVGGLQSDHKFGSWLFGIAHQRCIQRWRRRVRETEWRDEVMAAPPAFDPAPDELLIEREREAGFMRCLNALPAPQRSALMLHFVEDFSLEEIARITDTGIGTVKSRIHYGKKALREGLKENMT